MDLTELLKGNIPQDLIGTLSQQMGTEPQQTQSAAQSIFTTLLGGLAKNASTEEGAQGILGALDRDHDGSVLNDLGGLLTGAMGSSQATNGAGILGHILGSKQQGAVDMVSQTSGIDANSAMSMMLKLAPILMGVLGKAKQDNGLDAGGLSGLLSGVMGNQQVQEQNPLVAIATRFIDQDGDGDIMDDLSGMGMNILGGMLKK
ncbi:MAG: DUF937 domain-containing protein [Saprospiraceae bacterium]|jgi:hypothetical protein|nr:DUF937 domain-containing protein [Saprospiraceae bacterium]